MQSIFFIFDDENNKFFDKFIHRRFASTNNFFLKIEILRKTKITNSMTIKIKIQTFFDKIFLTNFRTDNCCKKRQQSQQQTQR